MIGTEITKEFKTVKPKKSMCLGCRNNMYNSEYYGGCASFKNAKVGILQGFSSPYENKRNCKMRTLTCYHSR